MYRLLTEKHRQPFNRLATHPLASWEWGEFRQSMGLEVIRMGFFQKNRLSTAMQMTLHPIPFVNMKVGYIPKGPQITKELIQALTATGHKHNCIFIQLEPNIVKIPNLQPRTLRPRSGQAYNLQPSTRPLFTKYTFQIDLTLCEAELLKRMSSKTRYNVRLAKRKGVTVQEENTPEAFARYLELTQKTTKRQGFYAHDENYHRTMWEFLYQRPTTNDQRPIAHLLTARYQGEILVTWILFLFNNVLYYPYGASSDKHRNVMASNLIMWEAIRWGKKHGAHTFDLWGTPGQNPKSTDLYYGFHRFKLGYAPKLIEFVGSFDLVLKQPHYHLFQLANKIRWGLLKLKSSKRLWSLRILNS